MQVFLYLDLIVCCSNKMSTVPCVQEEVSFYNRIQAADRMIVYQYRTGEPYHAGLPPSADDHWNKRYSIQIFNVESKSELWLPSTIISTLSWQTMNPLLQCGQVICCYCRSEQMPCKLYSWSLDGVPPDGHPLLIISSVHLAVIIVFYIITLLGITFAIACLVFNFVFRDRKYVCMNLILIRGGRLFYIIILNSLLVCIGLRTDKSKVELPDCCRSPLDLHKSILCCIPKHWGPSICIWSPMQCKHTCTYIVTVYCTGCWTSILCRSPMLLELEQPCPWVQYKARCFVSSISFAIHHQSKRCRTFNYFMFCELFITC